MNGEVTENPVAPGAAELAAAAFQDWQSGNQQGAIERIREAAEQNQAWAVGLTSWMFMQQGIPGFERAVPYAKQALALGMPWVGTNLFNNIAGNLSNAPHLLEPLLDMISTGMIWSSGIDPVGQGWNLLAQGQPHIAVRVMSVTSNFPTTPGGWETLLSLAQSQSQELGEVVASARRIGAQVQAVGQESIEAISKRRAELETVARQAGILVSSVNSEAINTLFEADAARNAKESRTSWRWGIGVLVVAAGVAVLPLVLHYFGKGPAYSSATLLGAHAASTAALGAVAGVLLARARGRDRAHQRARDISTAMGTMIAYSNQIQDDAEKQRFMLTMGQLVLQAHLQGDSAPREESLSGLAALLAVMRQPSQTP